MIAQQQAIDKNTRVKLALNNPLSIKRELCKRSLFYFIKEFWDVIVQDKPKWNWHIEYLCSELERLAYKVSRYEPKDYDLIINIPPGETKSLICSVFFPPWCWTKWHWMRFMAGGYSGDLSNEHVVLSRV